MNFVKKLIIFALVGPFGTVMALRLVSGPFLPTQAISRASFMRSAPLNGHQHFEQVVKSRQAAPVRVTQNPRPRSFSDQPSAVNSTSRSTASERPFVRPMRPAFPSGIYQLAEVRKDGKLVQTRDRDDLIEGAIRIENRSETEAEVSVEEDLYADQFDPESNDVQILLGETHFYARRILSGGLFSYDGNHNASIRIDDKREKVVITFLSGKLDGTRLLFQKGRSGRS